MSTTRYGVERRRTPRWSHSPKIGGRDNLRRGITMRKFIAAGAVAALALIPAGTAFAAGNGQNGPTTGDCISDIFYGNEPNMANGATGGPAEQATGTQAGNVLPSQSPGPFKTLAN